MQQMLPMPHLFEKNTSLHIKVLPVNLKSNLSFILLLPSKYSCKRALGKLRFLPLVRDFVYNNGFSRTLFYLKYILSGRGCRWQPLFFLEPMTSMPNKVTDGRSEVGVVYVFLIFHPKYHFLRITCAIPWYVGADIV